MDKGAYLVLLEMTGFDLRTFCGSLEKLIDYTGERNKKNWDMKQAVTNLNKELIRLLESL